MPEASHGASERLAAGGRSAHSALMLCYALSMKKWKLLFLLPICQVVLAEATQWSLSADDWARPRDGQSVAQMPPLAEVVSAWSKQSGQRLLIRYPGGEDGLLWAYELRSWLVALGVPLADQELVAGSHQADRIELELMR